MGDLYLRVEYVPILHCTSRLGVAQQGDRIYMKYHVSIVCLLVARCRSLISS